jgi:cellulose 1,4-beta-cellobiosidase
MATKLLALTALLQLASSQAVGNQTKETHPKLSWSKCSSGGSCTTVAGEITIDANWRWLHDINGYTNCYTGNTWNSSICTDGKSCATKCAVDGAEYSATYGITTSGNQLSLKFVTKGSYCEFYDIPGSVSQGPFF